MVDDADVYSRSLDEAVSNSLVEGEVEILGRETFATGDTSFADQLNNIKESESARTLRFVSGSGDDSNYGPGP